MTERRSIAAAVTATRHGVWAEQRREAVDEALRERPTARRVVVRMECRQLDAEHRSACTHRPEQRLEPGEESPPDRAYGTGFSAWSSTSGSRWT